MLKLRLIASMAIVSFVLPTFTIAQPMADKIPADAMLYIGWSGAKGLGDKFEESNLKGFLKATNLSQLLDNLKNAANQAAEQQQPGAAEAVNAGVEVLEFVWKYPTAIYFSADMEKEKPKGLVLFQAGADTEKLLALLKGHTQDASTPEDPVLVRLVGDTIVLSGSFMPDEPTIVADSTKSLAADPDFKNAVAGAGDDSAFTFYFNVENMINVIDTAAKKEASPEELEQWKKVRDVTGIDGLKRVVYSAGFKGKNWGSSVFIDAPAPRKGLIKLLDGEPISSDTLKVVPRDVTWVKGMSFDLGALMDTARTIIKQVEPNAEQELDNALAQAKQMTGVDIENDLIKAFGSRWVMYSNAGAPGVGLFNPHFVVINHVKDAEKVEASLSALEKMAIGMMAGQGGGDFGPPQGPQVQSNIIEQNGVKIHSITVPQGAVQWTVHNKVFYFSATPGGLDAALAAAKGDAPSVLENAGFAALKKRLDVMKVNSVTYIDVKKTAAPIHQALMMVLPMAQGFLIKEFPEMKPIAIAPLHEITPHLGPVAEMSWMDDKGLHSRSISPFPGAGMLSPDLFTMAAPAGVGAAIALPAVNAARGKAREVVSVNNLRQISMAMMIHVQDHNVYPKDLGELLTRQIVDSAEVFISPRDDIDVPAGFDQWDNQKKAAWVNANSSYVIITLGQKPKGGVENIVGFEKFHPDKRQIPLVFEDGHVEQMSPAEARRRIEKQTGKTVEQLQGTKLIN